jgi:apolipoprotein N-acyltransferase
MICVSSLPNWKKKKRAVAAFLLGVCATLSLPPFFVLPMLMLSVCGWFVLARSALTGRQALLTGWWWGLGFFMSGLYWMCISLLVDAEKFAWLIPFCLFGLNGIIALYPALATFAFWKISKKFQLELLPATLLFVVCWSVSEYLRSLLFTGFPWNLVGYTWAVWVPAMQSASIIGIQGLTLITMLLAISPIWFSLHRKTFMGLWTLWAAVLVWGVQHVPTNIAETKTQIRIVQASIPQTLKWDPKERINGIRKHFSLSIQDSEVKPDIIIWPESAVPLAINQEPILTRDLAKIAPEKGALITGGIRIDDAQYYNSIYAITNAGIAAVYDKHHLVPFGEFVPFRSILPLDKITYGTTDFSRGKGALTMDIDGIPSFNPLVCYEAIFSGDIHVDPSRTRWMLNLTNDAWFGTSTGPYQHFHMTRFRAVEFGLPLVRAANTGISAVIDPYGRITHSLGLNESGALNAALPEARMVASTWFAYLGNLPYLLMLCVILGLLFWRNRQKSMG